ncbi:hypothetical protein SAMN05443252_102294 [Bacillus sp. OV322]|uniref:hypothetical protein n=1 Tax=Bacillus sp. OV322 TaxID=1882764 RepID=UPI0008E4E5C1|nr:hypothetical protein [Bacillus sp. OV322]SFC22882.1 hypothetical protein SAMN05443252_102294 [Bacillus sp. OV322]
MSKKKAIKLVTASAIAASAFAAVAPTQSHAATSINTVVANAQKSMRAPFDKYYQTGITKKTVPAITVQNLINAGQKAYTDASAAVKKAGGKYAKTNQAKLDSYKKYLERSKAYVSALNEISLIYKQADGAVKAENLGDLKSAEAVLKNASNKGFVGISKVYGPATRDVLKATFTRLSADKLAKVQYTIAKVTSKVESVNAINATTVEVTMKDAVNAKNLDSLHFTIDGLTVTNAAVKQTNDKVVVLTTSVQDGAKEYSVKLNGDTLGFTFKGRSAVLPTSISFVSSSQQAKVGGQVTVKADIGQKVAGVPVTFNIDADADIAKGGFNKDQVVEVLTNADGVAEYSYTQYGNGVDSVKAYATGNPNVYSSGKVYWASSSQLSVSEITSGNELANGTKKSYKVTGAADTTYYVAIKENLAINPDKITNVKVQDYRTSSFVTPYELNTGSDVYATVHTNSAGEGSFTVYGDNLTATPIVYLPSSVNTNSTDYSYSGLSLQSQAPTVKFSQVNLLALNVVAEGVANSAEYQSTPLAYDGNSTGGRTYTVTVKDKDGKLAPEGTTAYVTFEDGNINGNVYFSTGTNNFQSVSTGSVKAITVGKNGQATFRVAGTGSTTFVKPTVFLNTAGSVSPALDKTDVQFVADATYFKAPVVTNAVLSVTDAQGNDITSSTAGTDAYVTYQSVDQNGFNYHPALNRATGTYSYDLSFDVTSTFGDAKVKDASGNVLNATQNLGNTKTYKVTSDSNGQAVIRVTTTSADTVSVNVTGASGILPTKTATVSFAGYDGIPTKLTSARVTSVDTANNRLKLDDNGTDTAWISYTNASFYKANGDVTTLVQFEDSINTGDVVTFERGADGKHIFRFVNDYAVAAAATNPSFTDTDADRGEVAGELTFTGTAGNTYKVYVGNTLLGDANVNASTGAGSYTVANNTVYNGSLKIIATNSNSLTTATTTVNLTDLSTNNEASAALSKINAAAKAKVWDDVTIGDFTTAGVTGVTQTNFLDVKSGVQDKRALKGSSLTVTELQEVVDSL